uniref:Uncharacterized protein n=1 Tax=Anguilla anguilla TaxID=7936 RepID=A0A0E9PCC9_ANGAN
MQIMPKVNRKNRHCLTRSHSVRWFSQSLCVQCRNSGPSDDRSPSALPISAYPSFMNPQISPTSAPNVGTHSLASIIPITPKVCQPT